MDVTRRYWGEAATAGLLVGGAVLLARPLLLVGAAGLSAWILARQGSFVRWMTRLETGLTVEQSIGREAVTVGEEVAVNLIAELEEPVGVDVRVSAAPPVGSGRPATDDRRVRIPAGERRASTRFFLQPEIAGRQQFDRPMVAITTDRFASTYRTGSAPSLAVRPSRPRNVGVGGTRDVSSFVESMSGRRNSGLDWLGIRQYVAGDALSRIDWKTTARLRKLHVVEFEADSDIRTTLVVDHRATMGLGPDGERKLDYARQVALATLEAAREEGEPLGLFCVGDRGMTTRQRLNSTPGHYTKIRTRLHDLSPTSEAGSAAEEAEYRRPGEVLRMAKRLRGEDSSYANHVVPFLSDTGTYIRRLGSDPFYATVQTGFRRNRGADIVVFVTDDEHQTEIFEAARAARRGNNQVAVFLLPSVLFEPGELTDLENAYERYVEFDDFCRDLESVDGVDVFEVGPHERIEALRMRPRRRSVA